MIIGLPVFIQEALKMIIAGRVLIYVLSLIDIFLVKAPTSPLLKFQFK